MDWCYHPGLVHVMYSSRMVALAEDSVHVMPSGFCRFHDDIIEFIIHLAIDRW